MKLEKRLLTVSEVADYLGVSYGSIYTMVKEEQIPHFKAMRRILFSTEILDAWLEEQNGSSPVIKQSII